MCQRCHYNPCMCNTFHSTHTCRREHERRCERFWESVWTFITGSLVVAFMVIILSLFTEIWTHYVTGHDSDFAGALALTGLTWFVPMGFVRFVKMLSD